MGRNGQIKIIHYCSSSIAHTLQKMLPPSLLHIARVVLAGFNMTMENLDYLMMFLAKYIFIFQPSTSSYYLISPNNSDHDSYFCRFGPPHWKSFGLVKNQRQANVHSMSNLILKVRLQSSMVLQLDGRLFILTAIKRLMSRFWWYVAKSYQQWQKTNKKNSISNCV